MRRVNPVTLFAVSALALATIASAASPTSDPFAARRDAVERQPVVPLPVPPDQQFVDAAQNELAGLWFVELSSPPVSDGGTLTDTRRDRERFRAAAAAARVQFEERRAFDTLWNGLSIRIDPRDLPKLGRVPGVVALYPVETFEPNPQPEAGVDLFNALSMTGADRARDELGFTGAGVRVGIIDSGIDYHHPDLGGCFGPGCRVEFGWDFVGDAYEGPESTEVPDPDPDDPCQGHGTHVAGIVGADGVVTGVAPGVTLGAYRIFGCDGPTTADLIIAAMERALADGMDVINMSLGSSRQWPQYPTAAAATRLVNSGVVVVASFGNSGSLGLYAGGAPGVGEKVIGVASIANIALLFPSFRAEGRSIPYRTMANAADPPGLGSDQIVYIGRACNADPLLANPAGRVALAVRGDCLFRDKAMNAFAAGATSVVIHNNRFGMIFGTVLAPPLTRPVVAITQEDGLFLRDLDLPAGISWTTELTPGAIAGGGLMNTFSSFGLSPALQLKPDLAAPGGSIYSTYPLEWGAYATLSGTSMAAPHVAGAAALILEARPHTPAQVVRDILQNSADPVANSEDLAPEVPQSVHHQGAGMVDVDDAIRAAVRISPGKLSLGELDGQSAVRSLEIENDGSSSLIFDLAHTPAVSTAGVIEPSFSTAAASVRFAVPSITIPAGGTASLDITVEAPTGLQYGQFGGYIELTPRDGGASYRVPYAGFAGDYQAIPVLTPTTNGFPWLAASIGNRLFDRPAGATYTFEGNDVPWFIVHLDHQVRRLRVEVFDAFTGRAWHRALELEHFTRNSLPNSFFALSWDGMTTHGEQLHKVPNGSYRARLSVQKALGDDDDPQHWESWTSPIITIARPFGQDPGKGTPDRDSTATTETPLAAPSLTGGR